MHYEADILEEFERERTRPRYPTLAATTGLVVEHRASGFCGEVVAATAEAVTLRDRHDRLRHFRWQPGAFALDGRAITLTLAAQEGRRTAATPRRTNSGSRSAAPAPARVARASRIWVEGRHDAELIEHVWGDDLRELAVVVEPMHGADDLAAAVTAFRPARERRLGVLLDHLVAGSKEARLAASVRDPHVLVTGHPFVDVWAGIRPEVLGIAAWPDVPMGGPWKEGICRALGVPLDGFWPRVRDQVRTYADLRPELVGAVEQLIDFVWGG